MLPLNNYLTPKTLAYVLPQIHLKVNRGVYSTLASSIPLRSSSILRMSSTSKTRFLNSGSSETFLTTKRCVPGGVFIGKRVGKTLPYDTAVGAVISMEKIASTEFIICYVFNRTIRSLRSV